MSPVTGVMVSADGFTPADLITHVRRLEELGYREVWVTDVFGREIYVTIGHILANTTTLHVVSGIAHIHGRDAISSAQAGRTLNELYGGRFLQGLGVSHPVAAEMRGVEWTPPVETIADYVRTMRSTPHIHTPRDAPEYPIFIAAHGPKMLAAAAEVADGANLYMQQPSHTATARGILGPGKRLNIVLPCALTTDAAVGRKAGRRALSIYLPLPAYQRRWAAQGFDESDWSDGGSDRLVDAFIPWGDADQLVARMQEHIDAGADEIQIGPLPTAGHETPWDLLEALA